MLLGEVAVTVGLGRRDADWDGSWCEISRTIRFGRRRPTGPRWRIAPTRVGRLTGCSPWPRLALVRATSSNPSNGRRTVKLRFLGKDSTPDESPTLYATDRDSYVIQG
jgi:hypothetical protein